ncbi:MAG TPA: peptide-methionine (R)-S-oxide reductase MsrB [Pseudomonadota bacterium]|nr:peptide-methionine (R)-S-oxide reductase MsrB [Pseudomonadota bacterium]
MLDWKAIEQIVRKGNPAPPRRVERDEAEWKQLLPPEVFSITRRAHTERPHTSLLCRAVEPGRYSCACCNEPLFDATTKFDSGSGWPSFTQPLSPNVVAYHGDDSHGMLRVETTCAVCDAHLGHVFPDGPAPSRLRYCINGLALVKVK